MFLPARFNAACAINNIPSLVLFPPMKPLASCTPVKENFRSSEFLWGSPKKGRTRDRGKWTRTGVPEHVRDRWKERIAGYGQIYNPRFLLRPRDFDPSTLSRQKEGLHDCQMKSDSKERSVYAIPLLDLEREHKVSHPQFPIPSQCPTSEIPKDKSGAV
eukprot:TRINITY_DN3334_c0_g1_i2.p1 TRINITY_DN3334_c0_g1~~TRINITY_DN3334_c0_g1_i2.p1  ORF type:complete len:187 (+),score=27.99 TRINITY_DN3334_c0_g1_i2:87-563(+)